MKNIFKLFIPTFLAYILFASTSIIDGIFVGNLYGTAGQSAIGLSMPLVLIITSVSFSLVIGGNTFLGHAIGEKDDQKANDIFNTIVIYGTIFIAIVVALILLLIVPLVMNNIGDTIIKEYFAQYVYIIIPSFILMTLVNFLMFNQRLIGNTNVMIYVSLITLFTNIIFNTFFTLVLNTGIRGIAFASLLAFVIQLIFMIYMYKKNNIQIFKLRFIKFQPKNFFRMLLNGLSDGIFDLATSLVQVVNIVILTLFVGKVAPSYIYVLNSILIIQLMVFFSLSDSMNPLISVEYGKGNYKATKNYRNRAFIISIVLGIVAYFVLIIIREPLLYLFGITNINDINFLLEYSKYYFLVVFVFGLNQSITAFLTAVGKSKTSLLYGVFRNVFIIVVMSIIMSYLFGKIGLASSYFIAEVFSLIVGLIILKYTKIENKK